jgi:hypothetical protein
VPQIVVTSKPENKKLGNVRKTEHAGAFGALSNFIELVQISYV